MNQQNRKTRYMDKLAAAGTGLVLASPAFAALPEGVATALTGIQTDGLALIALVTGVVLAFLAPSVIIKLIKRFGNKV